MTERHRRPRSRNSQPPSRQMRSLMRQAFFEVHRLLRCFRYAGSLTGEEAADVLRVLKLCRRALARERAKDQLVALEQAGLPDMREATAELSLAHEMLAAVDIVWDRRLIAAGIDPKWPDSGA